MAVGEVALVARPGVLRGSAVFCGLTLALAAACLVSLSVGRLSISLGTVWTILASRLFPVAVSWTPLDESIVLLVRAPRVLLAALAGAGLAMCGAALQGLFQNPLLEPRILGISGGAAFGGALAILLGSHGVLLIGSAFIWGLSALIAVAFVSRATGRSEVLTVVLAGIVVEALFQALLFLTEFLADPNSSLPAIIGWVLGSFATATWERLGVAAPVILVGTAGLFLLRYRINVLSLGEDDARAFGARAGVERWLVLVLVALITAGVIAVSGVVAWVGLIVPHAARLLVGSDHRLLVPASALIGGAYLVLVDTLARTVTAAEIPLGVITALLGAPVFAVLLRRYLAQRAQP